MFCNFSPGFHSHPPPSTPLSFSFIFLIFTLKDRLSSLTTTSIISFVNTNVPTASQHNKITVTSVGSPVISTHFLHYIWANRIATCSLLLPCGRYSRLENVMDRCLLCTVGTNVQCKLEKLVQLTLHTVVMGTVTSVQSEL